jgi:amino acid transporter
VGFPFQVSCADPTVPKNDIKTSKQITAYLFFSNVFGDKAAQGLTILPVISALGNVLAVVVGQARMVREIGRQGVLPYPKFWVTTKPFGSPVGSVLVIWALTIIMIVAPPAGSAFNFIVSLKNWPDSVFLGLMAIGLLRLRRQRTRLGIPLTEYRSWTWVVLLFILSKVYLIIMPWVPPKGTTVSPSFGFFYATSPLVAVGVVALMVIYYYLWTKLLPKIGHYKLRQNVLEHEDGSVGSRFVKVPEDQVAEWDAKHDPAGRSISGASSYSV